MTKDDNKHRVVFYMDADDYLRFKSWLVLEGESVSGYLRERVYQYLEDHEDTRRPTP